MANKPRVGIVMGSDSDWPTMAPAAEALKEFGVEYEAEGVGGVWWGRYSRRLFGQIIEIRRPDG